MSEKLKPCPFCPDGGKSVSEPQGTDAAVHCHKCGGVRVPRSEFFYKRDAILYAAVIAGRNVATLAELKELRPDMRIVRVR